MKKDKHNDEVLKSIVGKHLSENGFPITKITGLLAHYIVGLDTGKKRTTSMESCDSQIHSMIKNRRDK